MNNEKSTSGVLDQKKKIPMVEIVMWVVVIAAILAILIPIYINLGNRVTEAERIERVNDHAEQMLASMLGSGDDGCDIILIREQTDGIYVYMYDLSLKTLKEYSFAKDSGTFDSRADEIINDLLSRKLISKADVDGGSWRSDENVKSIINELELSSDNVRVYASYIIDHTVVYEK